MDKIKCKQNKARIFLPAVFMLLPAICMAQSLTLYDAVDKTVKNYPLLQQRSAEISGARAHMTTVNGNRLPTLILQDQINAGTNNGLQGAYYSLGIVPSTSGSSSGLAENTKPNAGNVAISFLQWEFFNFGYYKAQSTQAGAQLAVSEAKYGSDRYLLTQNAVALYLDWLKKYRLVQIQKENMQRAEVILTAIRATVMSGLKPGVDSSTARAAYSDARIAYLQAQDEFDFDEVAVSTYTGMGRADLVPDTSLLSGGMPDFHLPVPNSVPASHPVLEVYERQYELQVAENHAVNKKYLPKLGLDAATWVRSSGVSYSGTYPESLTAGFPYSKYNYLVGLTLTYNLFDLKHRHDQATEGMYQAEAKLNGLKTEELALSGMMRQANATYAATLEKLKELPIQLASARQAYGQQMALYRSGLNTLIEVTNANYVLLQAETKYVIAQEELMQLLFIRAGLSGQSDILLQKFKR